MNPQDAASTSAEKPDEPVAPEEIFARYLYQLGWEVGRVKLMVAARNLHRLEDADFDRDLISAARRQARSIFAGFEAVADGKASHASPASDSEPRNDG